MISSTNHDPDSRALLDFLRGAGRDWDGRLLSDIRRFTETEMEEDHHYIQWLFPLTTPSEAVFAPILSPGAATEFRRDTTLQQAMEASTRQMLGFFGLAVRVSPQAIVVEQGAEFAARSAVWMTPENHNYRRISRMLASLVLAGLPAWADAFHAFLHALAGTPEGRGKIDALALWYWEQAVRR